MRFINSNGIEIGNNVYIATGAWLNGLGGIILEDNVQISPYVIIDTCIHVFINNMVTYRSIVEPIKVGRGTWVASHAIVKAGVNIGSGVLVAGNSAVVKDVPDNVMVGGVPAKVIGPRREKDLSKTKASRYFD